MHTAGWNYRARRALSVDRGREAVEKKGLVGGWKRGSKGIERHVDSTLESNKSLMSRGRMFEM